MNANVNICFSNSGEARSTTDEFRIIGIKRDLSFVISVISVNVIYLSLSHHVIKLCKIRLFKKTREKAGTSKAVLMLLGRLCNKM